MLFSTRALYLIIIIPEPPVPPFALLPVPPPEPVFTVPLPPTVPSSLCPSPPIFTNVPLLNVAPPPCPAGDTVYEAHSPPPPPPP